MEVLFHGHWHDGSYSKTSSKVERRDAGPEESGALDTGPRVTIPQATLFILWAVACVLLVVRYLYSRRRWAPVVVVDLESLPHDVDGEEKKNLLEEEEREQNGSHGGGEPASNENNYGRIEGSNGNLHRGEEGMKSRGVEKMSEDSRDVGKEGCSTEKSPPPKNVFTTAAASAAGTKAEKNFSSVKPPPSFDKFLCYAVGLGVILMYFFLCDVWHEWPAGERVYNRDQFMFLSLLMFLVAAAFTVHTCPDKILNRDQTEEWKGWMQVMFVWYHYFKAAETYNLVRVYIACYVWMTGFGNFSFFWVKKDFSLWRMLKMLFRLNFLVVLVVLVTNNSYMLYYICAMHTYWFFTVYLFMFTLSSWNENRGRMALKFLVYFICNAVIFDTPLLHYFFRPFWLVLSYEDSLHEWKFRAGLDHYACLVGMLCAYNYPHYERWMNHLDKRQIDQRDRLLSVSIKVFVIGVLLLFSVIWYKEFMLKEKYDYNRIHPYTSWFPILAYITLRNMFPVLRTHYLYFLTFLGKITLETYISQLHVFLQSNAKELIVYIPNYPLMNFALATAVYLFISYWLFEITTVFSSFLLPRSMKTVGIHLVVSLIVCSLAACTAFLVKEASIL